MKISELIGVDANINITVKGSDLIEFANYIVMKTKSELEEAVASDKTETYLTRNQASEKLHVNLSSLWRWWKSGYLVPVEVGGKRLYKMSDIEAILNGESR